MIISVWHFALASLVLQFDGSFRPPRDSGFPTDELGRLASCSAAVLVDPDDDDDDDDNEQVIALGGKTIPHVHGMTSADAEFEGLLMGLDYLVRHQQSVLSANKNRSNNELIVQGDCKTVIDLMNHRARARKLESKYVAANKYLAQLNRNFEKVEFQHIFRGYNQLCDAVSNMVTNFAVEQAFMQFKADHIIYPASEMLNIYFGKDSILPFSQRSYLYGMIIERARENRDGIGIHQLGQQLEKQYKQWRGRNGESNSRSHLAFAIGIQIEGCELCDNMKEASKLRRKHRFILEQHPEVPDSFLLAHEYTGRSDQAEMDEIVVDCSNKAVALQQWKEKASHTFLVDSTSSMRSSKQEVWVSR